MKVSMIFEIVLFVVLIAFQTTIFSRISVFWRSDTYSLYLFSDKIADGQKCVLCHYFRIFDGTYYWYLSEYSRNECCSNHHNCSITQTIAQCFFLSWRLWGICSKYLFFNQIVYPFCYCHNDHAPNAAVFHRIIHFFQFIIHNCSHLCIIGTHTRTDFCTGWFNV